MPKKQARNPFFFFMQDWKKREEAMGRRFPNGLKDVQANAECNKEWQSLTHQQKAPFEVRAKDSKIRDRGVVGKLTSTGQLLSALEKETKRQQEFEENMKKYIMGVVNMAADQNRLHTIKFYFIHVNWMCRKIHDNNRVQHYPAEFAVAEFSLEHGVQKIYHEIINVSVPLGYAREARETSQQSHQIPIQLATGQDDFSIMYKKIIDILKPEMQNGKLPPLYTTKKIIPVVSDLLKQCAEAVKEDMDMFLVYSLEVLFMNIRNAAAQKANQDGFPLTAVADNEFVKDSFGYTPGLECSFHKSLDGTSLYCSMSVVKRWAFTICDHCCEDVNIKLIPGKHLPINTEIVQPRSLNESMSLLDINDTEACGVVSMTGVSKDHRTKTSERTYEEEEERRKQKSMKSLEIIYHSNNATASSPRSGTSTIAPRIERPLRPPHTKSYAMAGADLAPSLNEMNFPTIGGRGMSFKKKAHDNVPSIGRGRGSLLTN